MIIHLEDEYFKWMVDIARANRFSDKISYNKLLSILHDTEFTWIIPKDSNRAEDGKDLRWRFACLNNIDIGDYLDGPCSIFEMILALAIRCEESIMDNPKYGDRTSQWFWKMITNLGLGSMTDSRFDEEYVKDVIFTFLNREYDANGRGGLFIVRNCEYDMRDLEIWNQMILWLDTIV